MDAYTALIETIKTTRQHLNPTAQAKELGISQPHWHQVMTGKKRLGQRALNRIRGRCKDLEPLAIAALMERS